jgi:hypothetical protein
VRTDERWREAEYKLLCRAIVDAGVLLADDHASAGYRCLHEGLERAAELAETGADWASDLADSYRSALFHYSCLYPVPTRLPRGSSTHH